MVTLPRLPGIERLTVAELQELVRVADRLGVSPRELAVVIYYESSFRTTARNLSGATGLLQWTDKSAAELGTTTDAIARMSATEQLQLAERSLSRFAPKLQVVGDLYIANFMPSRGLGRPDDTVLAREGSDTYARNEGLDLDRDGAITNRDLRARVLNALASYPMTVDVPGPSDPAPVPGSAFAPGEAQFQGSVVFLGVLGVLYLTWRISR